MEPTMEMNAMVEMERECLKCRESFLSAHRGIRICQRCTRINESLAARCEPSPTENGQAHKRSGTKLRTSWDDDVRVGAGFIIGAER